MSFSFSFSGDDIEDDHSDQSDSLASKLENTTFTETTHSAILIPPKRHSLAELLQSLPSQVSYNWLKIPTDNSNHESEVQSTGSSPSLKIPRRALFDIRQQLMHEADPTAESHDPSADDSANSDATANLLAGLETGDLSSGVYEGGFKTWECALDLASLVSKKPLPDNTFPVHFIEIGAGSAIPSLVLLQRILQQRLDDSSKNSKPWTKTRFTLCDYNEDVLRLCTAINVFLTVAVCEKHGRTNGSNQQGEVEENGDIEIDETEVQRTTKRLEEAHIEVEFISGAWGEDFMSLLQRQAFEKANEVNVSAPKTSSFSNTLVLASETIYSPASLGVFSQTVLELLRLAPGDRSNSNAQTDRDKAGTEGAQALVAAKKVYFGVGGGVAEFEDQIRKRSGRVETVLDVKGAGVGRVVLEVFVH